MEEMSCLKEQMKLLREANISTRKHDITDIKEDLHDIKAQLVYFVVYLTLVLVFRDAEVNCKLQLDACPSGGNLQSTN